MRYPAAAAEREPEVRSVPCGTWRREPNAERLLPCEFQHERSDRHRDGRRPAVAAAELPVSVKLV